MNLLVILLSSPDFDPKGNSETKCVNSKGHKKIERNLAFLAREPGKQTSISQSRKRVSLLFPFYLLSQQICPKSGCSHRCTLQWWQGGEHLNTPREIGKGNSVVPKVLGGHPDIFFSYFSLALYPNHDPGQVEPYKDRNSWNSKRNPLFIAGRNGRNGNKRVWQSSWWGNGWRIWSHNSVYDITQC